MKSFIIVKTSNSCTYCSALCVVLREPTHLEVSSVVQRVTAAEWMSMKVASVEVLNVGDKEFK